MYCTVFSCIGQALFLDGTLLPVWFEQKKRIKFINMSTWTCFAVHSRVRKYTFCHFYSLLLEKKLKHAANGLYHCVSVRETVRGRDREGQMLCQRNGAKHNLGELLCYCIKRIVKISSAHYKTITLHYDVTMYKGVSRHMWVIL